MKNFDKDIMTRDELADYLGCSTRSIANWVEQRLIPCIKINRTIRFKKTAVDAALEKLQIGA